MNPILETIIEDRNGFYVHTLEVNDVYELKNAIECIYEEFVDDYSIEDIIEFFDTIELYCLAENNDDEVYNFSITEYINSL